MAGPWTDALLSAAALGCAWLCIRAHERADLPRIFLFKPATMLCVIALAARPGAGPYAAAVLVGLLFSLAGDVWLMLPRDRFAAGLACFLVAHLCYVAAFAGPEGLRGGVLGLAPFAALAVAMLAWLLPAVPGAWLRAAVAVYVAAICAMGWQAAERAAVLRDAPALLALAGALLFIASDAALACDRFRRPFAAAHAVILATYFGGQWLIALSTGAGSRLLGAFARGAAEGRP
jgi:uncharacterized membrane protein YhhN